MFESVDGRTHGWTDARTPARVPSYKLTLWAFSSGELTTEKRWRHHFPHYKSMGVSVAMETNFDPICPKTLCRLSPTPMMLHIKFDQDWPTGFRDIQVKMCESFVTQGQVTPKREVWLDPKSNSTELLCLSWFTSNFDDDSIKIDWASMEIPFSHYKSMGNFLDAQGQLTP